MARKIIKFGEDKMTLLLALGLGLFWTGLVALVGVGLLDIGAWIIIPTFVITSAGSLLALCVPASWRKGR
jgi:hypothetical protein